MKFRAIFFDNDGILVDTEPVFSKALQIALDEMGFPGDARELSQRDAAEGKDAWDRFQKKIGYSNAEQKQLKQICNQNYSALLKKEVPRISGVKEVLKNCFQVDFWDTEEIANKIISVLKYNLIREEITSNAYRELTNISWKKQALQVIDIYNSLIN